MEAIETTAQFDEEGILKFDNLPKFKNRKAKMIIPLSENDEWYRLSSSNLSRVYNEDDPDYPLSLIKEPNESYGS